jgi:hypothetical protein
LRWLIWVAERSQKESTQRCDDRRHHRAGSFILAKEDALSIPVGSQKNCTPPPKSIALLLVKDGLGGNGSGLIADLRNPTIS